MKKVSIGTVGATTAVWAAVAWGATYDTGVIADLYTSNGGYMAVWLNGGYPTAVSGSECPSSNGWAGVSPDPVNKDIKAVLMMAKAMGQQVKIVIDGCEAGGAWFKIAHVYVQ
jgi:hypothetical protein